MATISCQSFILNFPKGLALSGKFEEDHKNIRTARPEILGRYLKTLREKAGLSQRGLATRLGRSNMFVWRVESGALQVDLPTLFDLADAFGVDALMIVAHVRDEARKSQP